MIKLKNSVVFIYFMTTFSVQAFDLEVKDSTYIQEEDVLNIQFKNIDTQTLYGCKIIIFGYSKYISEIGINEKISLSFPYLKKKFLKKNNDFNQKYNELNKKKYDFKQKQNQLNIKSNRFYKESNDLSKKYIKYKNNESKLYKLDKKLLNLTNRLKKLNTEYKKFDYKYKELNTLYENFKQDYSKFNYDYSKFSKFHILLKKQHQVRINMKIETLSEKEDKIINIRLLEKQSYFVIYSLIFVLFLLILLFRNYRHPLVRQLSKKPKSLLTLSPKLLIEAKERLSKIDRFETLLKTLEISQEKFDESLNFFKMQKEKKTELFTERLGANFEKEGVFYRVNLPESFNINAIKSFLLYVSDEPLTALETKALALQDKVFVLGQSGVQNALAQKAHDKTNFMIAPTASQLTELLLSVDAKKVLTNIFADCLLAKDVSPYQINGDIKNKFNFFGRVEILRDILGNSANYLLVGSRQLGKSSVLRALKRRYDLNPNFNCYLFTMDDDNILLEMQNVLGLEQEMSLEELVGYISKQDKKSIFLIDEADEFIETDAKNSYKITKAFRKLAQNGKATFVITGFWTLYYYVTSDYHAPIKNFGELIKLGGLDDEACKALMREPMKRIGIGYENSKIVDDLIVRCGNRANLIAITCHEVLKVVEDNVITQENIEHVVRHSTLEDYLKGWQKISRNEDENTLDRAILFLTLKEEKFRLADVVKMLASVGLDSIDENRINESLERLVIGYFLEKDRGNYSYRVPLFKEKLLYEDIEVLLKREVRRLKE